MKGQEKVSNVFFKWGNEIKVTQKGEKRKQVIEERLKADKRGAAGEDEGWEDEEQRKGRVERKGWEEEMYNKDGRVKGKWREEEEEQTSWRSGGGRETMSRKQGVKCIVKRMRGNIEEREEWERCNRNVDKVSKRGEKGRRRRKQREAAEGRRTQRDGRRATGEEEGWRDQWCNW